ncbi:hypothetical protein B1991_02280 [Rhodanobacter lindaniclasticus]|uniref:Uncharacterized protein n=1 Tax=Rhodanobacter lindaniclasticus TaxID=75310 RepID=A0A4S3KKT6_9GAMM|nr:hypothetical protein B1991_02280 [Rhodanobacter lindaniclasticus]
MSRLRAAEYLGVSVRTIRHWDAGRNRVPWSAVRLLRLVRSGQLGGLFEEWEGWTINRLGLHSPDGRTFRERDMRQLWLTVTQAALFRESYQRARSGGVGAQPLRAREGVSQAGRVAVDAAVSTPAAPAPPPTMAPPLSRRTALSTFPASRAAPAQPAAGTAAGAAGGTAGAAGQLGDRGATADQCGGSGRGAKVTPQCHHEAAFLGGTLGACNMEQTAPVCHSSALPHGSADLPCANRGGNKLNGLQSDVTLTPRQEPSCKGVA